MRPPVPCASLSVTTSPSAELPDTYGELVSSRTVCPRCGHHRTIGHGSYPLKNGIRRPRRLCLACGGTFNPNTGTPLNYLKKWTEWNRMPEEMERCQSVRRTAAHLGIHIATAFGWRHRLLAIWAAQRQPVLSGTVAASEAYVPYSEKGRRRRNEPAGKKIWFKPGCTAPQVGPFRRFLQGRPACVVFVCAEEQRAALVAGEGRPSAADLQTCLSAALEPGARVLSWRSAPYAEACRRLGSSHCDPMAAEATLAERQHAHRTEQLVHHFHAWLRAFRGVATRYVHHYVAWFRRLRWAPRSWPLPPE